MTPPHRAEPQNVLGWVKSNSVKLDCLRDDLNSIRTDLAVHAVRIETLEREDKINQEKNQHWGRYLVNMLLALIGGGAGMALAHLLGKLK